MSDALCQKCRFVYSDKMALDILSVLIRYCEVIQMLCILMILYPPVNEEEQTPQSATKFTRIGKGKAAVPKPAEASADGSTSDTRTLGSVNETSEAKFSNISYAQENSYSEKLSAQAVN